MKARGKAQQTSQSDLNNAWAGVPLAGRLYCGWLAALRLPRLFFVCVLKLFLKFGGCRIARSESGSLPQC